MTEGKALRDWWMLIVTQAGNHRLLDQLGVRVAYKPLLWFVKGGRQDIQRILTDVIASPQEKTDHEWQQSLVEARVVIEALTDPGICG